ncbi:MAG: acyl--CoA ligase [Chthoniobacter sp.]|nr:acyl--CoA ligase [Chthoniobacter sp.]
MTAWRQTSERHGEAAAIFDSRGATLRTFAGIESGAQAFAGACEDLPAGSVVAAQLGNSASWPEVLLALWHRRLVPLPLPDAMAATELEGTLATLGAAALVTLAGGQPHVQLRAAPTKPPAWAGPVPDLLKLTSGTTSAPRAIRFRATQLLADAKHICAGMGLADDDLNFGVIPFAHSYGFSNLLTPLLTRGVRLVASDDRLPRAILDGLAATRATVFPGTPVFFQKLAELENRPLLPALRLCITAGAPLPAAAAERFAARFGLKIHVFYGSSECGGISYDATEEPHYEDGFVGTPLPGVEVAAEGKIAGPVTVRSAAVGDGYFPTTNDPALGGGRFVPGDLVRQSGRGLHLAGRTSDIINVAGRKLNPLEVEARLAACPGVTHAVVFGIPSALRGEEPVACVAGSGLEIADVLRFCHETLSAWQVPRDIWIVSEIPANERGKINRRALAERYLERSAANR